MRARQTAFALLSILLVVACGAQAQEQPTWKVEPSGLVRVMLGERSMAAIELNAHGPNWQHAPQQSAAAQATDTPEGGKRVAGSLPIPNTDGGAIRFIETLRPLPRGFELEYDLAMDRDMKLDGVQVSLGLPVTVFYGKEVVISRPDEDPEVVSLPEEPATNFQLWRGDGATLEVAKGTPEAITIEFRAAADVVVQDLRQWNQGIFEIRFPAIMEEPPRQVFADDRLHLDFTVTFPEPEPVPAEGEQPGAEEEAEAQEEG